METINEKKPVWLSIIRWAARLIAVLFAIILIFSFTTEEMNPLSINPKNYFFQALWVLIPTGYLIGLWKERLGGLISLVSTLTLIVILLTRAGHSYSFFFYLILIIFTIPSLLYLIDWYFNRKAIVEANFDTN
jgi:hypothetical protein